MNAIRNNRRYYNRKFMIASGIHGFAYDCLLELGNHTVFATHGHPHNPDHLPPMDI